LQKRVVAALERLGHVRRVAAHRGTDVAGARDPPEETPMPTLSCVLLSLHCAALVAAQDPQAARVDRDAAIRHYATVEQELRLAPAPADAAVAARRAFVIDALRDYRERGDFGINRQYDGSRVPLFVDADGRRCAVAWLLDRTGNGDLTLAIQRRCNEAWVAELASDPALQAWLAVHGLSAVEAARIQAPGSGWVTTEPPPLPDPTDPPTTPTGGNGTKPGTTTPGGVGGQKGQPALTGFRRGMLFDAAEQATWRDWWEWNRGVFELPQRADAALAATTVVNVRLPEAMALLKTLSSSPHPQLRAAAVQALGRIGAPAEEVGKHLDDDAREVRLATLLALGGGGTAAHAHMLGKRAEAPQQGETLAVALAAMAVIEEGPAQRALEATVTGFLTDDRPSVRSAAALAARSGDDDDVRTAARAALAKATTSVERASVLSLLGLHSDAADITTLTKLANDRAVDVRRSAALALGRSKHPLALPALQTAYELEHDNITRGLQLLAIGDHAGDGSRAFLVKAMTDGNKQLRGHAALALGLWGRGRADADVADRIAEAFASERNSDQKGAYLLALGLLRHVPSRDLLAGELRDGSSSPTRGSAATSLGLLGDRAALPALQQAAVDDSCPWARQQAVRAMACLGNDAIDPLIATMKNDKDATVQRAAAFALGGLADPRVPAALLAFAADESVPATARMGGALGLGRHFRRHEPRLPALRFQHDYLLLPSVAAWAFGQEL
jgi:HEAT repeat protein